MVDNIEDSKTLQADLGKLVRWSEIWFLKFNVEKCKIMHIGHFTYSYRREKLGNSAQAAKKAMSVFIIIIIII